MYLFGRSDFQCSPAFQVVILASEVANHPVAERTCHSHGECVCRACKAKCKAGFLVRTIVITFTFSGYYPVRVHRRQENSVDRSILHGNPAQAGWGFRAVFGGAQAEGVGDFGEVEMRSHYFMDVDGYLLSAKVLNYAGNEQEWVWFFIKFAWIGWKH